MSLYSRWARKEHREGVRIGASLLAGVLFLFLLPYTIIKGGAALDRLIGLPHFDLGAWNYLFGGFLVVFGLTFAEWSIITQLTRGRGTPLPMLPTQELLVGSPFRYCRNPMTLGTILAYLGVGVAAGTIAGIGLVLVFAGLLIFYLKRFEEKELAERFGDAYLDYQREVPFMIPRFRRK